PRLRQTRFLIGHARFGPRHINPGPNARVLLVVCQRQQALRQIEIGLRRPDVALGTQRIQIGQRRQRRDLLARQLLLQFGESRAGLRRLKVANGAEVEDRLRELKPGVERIEWSDEGRGYRKDFGRQPLRRQVDGVAGLRRRRRHIRQQSRQRLYFRAQRLISPFAGQPGVQVVRDAELNRLLQTQRYDLGR